MSDLKIIFTGIGLCHYDKDISNWRVFVPHIIEEHDFVIKVTKKTNENIVLERNDFRVGIGSKIAITNDSVDKKVKEPNDTDLTETLDISSIHDDQISLLAEINKYAAFITLSGASLESDISEDVRVYDLWKVRDGFKVKIEKELKSRDSVFTNMAPEIGSLSSLLVNGERLCDDFAHESGVNFEIKFDNNCHIKHTQARPQSDFRFNYEIIDVGELKDPCRYELTASIKCDYVGCDILKAKKLFVPQTLRDYLNS